MNPTQPELEVAADAAARQYWAIVGHDPDHPPTPFDELDELLRQRIRETMAPFVDAVLSALPDRAPAARQEGREQVAALVRDHMCLCGVGGRPDGHERWCPASVCTEVLDEALRP